MDVAALGGPSSTFKSKGFGRRPLSIKITLMVSKGQLSRLRLLVTIANIPTPAGSFAMAWSCPGDTILFYTD